MQIPNLSWLNLFRVRLLLNFLSFIAVLLIWCASYFIIRSKQTHLQSVSIALTDVQTQYLESNSYLQKFMLSGFHDSSFYSTGKQPDIDHFLRLQNEISRDILNLKAKIGEHEVNVSQALDSLEIISKHTHRLGKELKMNFLMRGFENYGTEGRMRYFAHWIEDSTSVSKTSILQLRRHEKDFMLRGKKAYADLYFNEAKVLLTRSKYDTRTYQAVYQYMRHFAEFVTYTAKLGINDTSGIVPHTQHYTRLFGKQFLLTNDLFSKEAEQLQYIFNVELVVVSGLLIFLMVAWSVYLSKYLTQDIKELKKRMAAFIDSDFMDVQAASTETNHRPSLEVEQLNNGFNLLTITIKNYVENLNSRSEELQIQTEEMRLLNEELHLQKQHEQDARMEAEKANQAKSAFLATMSHEIRTPMNGVLGMASLIYETQLTAEQAEYVETIKISGEALLNVINDVLDFSKIESGMLDLDPHEFDLRGCIEDVVNMFARKAGQSGIDLIYHINDDVPLQLIADSTRLKQILINLLGNAFKFTVEGEVFLGISLLEQHENRSIMLEIEVKDTGIGIAAEKMAKLFKAFSQVDSSTTRKYGGSGLGLAICERLVHLMAGSIMAKSEPGKGTSFIFTINAQINKGTAHSYFPCNMEGQKGKKVLIVDDNETNRKVLSIQLSKWELEVEAVSSAVEALKSLEFNKFDLVISDMQMPDIDGVQLAEAIRIIEPVLPIILLSSIGDDLKHNYGHLFSAVLSKPAKQERLCQAMQASFQQQKVLTKKEQLTSVSLPPDFSNKFPLRILIAEDNLVNQKVIGKMLTKLGYQPAIASNGLEVLSLMKTQTYDLILMDIQMPEMDGLTATRHIRSNNNMQPVILAMTANVMQTDKDECLQAGMNDFISKPINVESLLTSLSRAFVLGSSSTS